ncbi:MAG TPA: right-handed parallel beta-helix repeat-containing protein [Chitinivibrionales bacterium]|nr:right-handed parallel beta-helix repeat-containing protein [Chitinivibrionales bacterium]
MQIQKNLTGRCLLVLLSLFSFSNASARYVSSSASGAQDGSYAHPFSTIQAAADSTVPGDTVYIMNGTYTNSWPTGEVVNITRSGSAAAWIVYAAYPGHKPKLQFNGWGGIYITGASYIEINGLEIAGNNASMDSATAYAVRADGNNCLTSGNGIMSYQTGSSPYPHHIAIRKCVVHDCGGGGISTQTTDYITIEENTVYNNAWYSPYDCSGISLGWNYSFDDDTTDYKVFVRRNRCYANKNCMPAIQGGSVPTDGEGIIIDIQDGTAGNVPAYNGRMLLENNVVFNNGGDGITLFKTNHVDVINNTAYMNDQTAAINRGQIFPNQGRNTRIINNIMVAPPGRNVMQDCCPNANLTVDYNIFWSASGTPSSSLIGKTGSHDKKADPRFANPSLDPVTANFHLQAGSPAIDSGTSANAPSVDFDGNARPAGAGIDIGAYEYGSGSGVVRPAHVPASSASPLMSVKLNRRTETMNIKLAARGDVEIVKLNGSRVATLKNIGDAEWNPGNVSGALYFVNVTINGKCMVAKLVSVK